MRLCISFEESFTELIIIGLRSRVKPPSEFLEKCVNTDKHNICRVSYPLNISIIMIRIITTLVRTDRKPIV